MRNLLDEEQAGGAAVGHIEVVSGPGAGDEQQTALAHGHGYIPSIARSSSPSLCTPVFLRAMPVVPASWTPYFTRENSITSSLLQHSSYYARVWSSVVD